MFTELDLLTLDFDSRTNLINTFADTQWHILQRTLVKLQLYFNGGLDKHGLTSFLYFSFCSSTLFLVNGTLVCFHHDLFLYTPQLLNVLPLWHLNLY